MLITEKVLLGVARVVNDLLKDLGLVRVLPEVVSETLLPSCLGAI